MTPAFDKISAFLGNRLSLSLAVREQHGTGEAYHNRMPPEAVAFARTIEEVQKIITVCNDESIPLIPFGSGTSLEGHVNAPYGGLSLDLSQMNQILSVHTEDLDCVCQPGVTREGLNTYLRDTGLFFSVDPGIDATIGGMIATRASGTNTVRYGTIRDNILALKVVLPDGSLVTTGRRAAKSAAGYDLTHLFIGSEGTLGVVVEATVKLHGLPEAMSSAVCAFDTLENAINSVITIVQLGIPIARVELLDQVQIDACNKFSKLSYPLKPTLFFEFHGSANGVQEQASVVKELTSEFGAIDFKWATTPEDRNHLWKARHSALYASKALRPGGTVWSTDVCVPISQLAECILETRRDIDNENLLAPILGHVGDGNFHVFFILDPNDADEFSRAKAVNDRLLKRALSMEGTCTGEHGVGIGKIKALEAELGCEAIAAMRHVKSAFDPKGIMNPGKVFSKD